MKVKLVSAAVVAILGFFANSASAQESDEQAVSPLVTTLTFASDYRFRGISQTFNNPVLQLDSIYTAESGLYLGIFGSTSISALKLAPMLKLIFMAVGQVKSLTDYQLICKSRATSIQVTICLARTPNFWGSLATLASPV